MKYLSDKVLLLFLIIFLSFLWLDVAFYREALSKDILPILTGAAGCLLGILRGESNQKDEPK